MATTSDGTGPGLKSSYSAFGISTFASISTFVSSSPWSGDTKVHATPVRPARAVRPMRCTYTSGSSGTS
jgi:hypothetical protein